MENLLPLRRLLSSTPVLRIALHHIYILFILVRAWYCFSLFLFLIRRGFRGQEMINPLALTHPALKVFTIFTIERAYEPIQ